MSSKDTTASFSNLFTLDFTEIQFKDAFLKDFAPLARHVEEHEPNTTAYKALLSDKNPLKVLIMERYKDKETAFLEVHLKSAPFLTLRSKLKAMEDAGHVNVSADFYYDSDCGFGDRVACN
mmetsp:Transcript_44099/g.86507  ORF Transcript_44099/g.86507 Transcript_44099/m.86507 type:complete len:121 (-) Transcript_44099:58-420(-)|eukprot:CAMPEP_0194323790 /NCGR_PEP_ID=MMETSP0171-20130528/25964_1 /TAXON_ID=218684 /ORGANISM="Corethron pennatum, Strain L29A3" /LENGTH=120 /DNA_ID=CAMNT_0039082515 /DNA_START=123 /DNA_END=485 /DNA_ORIENTATION=-